jgi:hypothetical protein
MKSISEALCGGKKGLAAMVQYLNDFVCQYEINEGLLEGKVERLIHAIQIR